MNEPPKERADCTHTDTKPHEGGCSVTTQTLGPKLPPKGLSLLKTRRLSYVARMSGSQHRSVFFSRSSCQYPHSLITVSLTFFAFCFDLCPFALTFFFGPLFPRMCRGCRHLCWFALRNTQTKKTSTPSSSLFFLSLVIVHKGDSWSEVQGAGSRPSLPFFFLVHLALIRHESALCFSLIQRQRTPFILCLWETERGTFRLLGSWFSWATVQLGWTSLECSIGRQIAHSIGARYPVGERQAKRMRHGVCWAMEMVHSISQNTLFLIFLCQAQIRSMVCAPLSSLFFVA